MPNTNFYGGDNEWPEPEVIDNEDFGDSVTDDNLEDDPEEEVVEPEAEEEAEEEEEIEEEEAEEEEESEDEEEAEEEEESEDEEEESEKESEEEPGKKRKVSNTIPRSRLNSEIKKRKALEAQLRKLQAEQASEPASDSEDIDLGDELAYTKEDFSNMAEALLDGNTDKAMEAFNAMMQAQRTADAKTLMAQATQRASRKVKAETVQDRVDAAAQELELKYPELDGNSDEANPELISDVVALRQARISRGVDPVEALQQAVETVARMNSLEDRTAEPEEEKPSIRKPIKSTSAKTKRKIEMAHKAPRRLKGSKKPKRVASILDMTDDLFEALSEEALAEARGDYI